MDVKDKNFDIANSVNYTLSIRYVPNGFCFAVFCPIENRIIAFGERTHQGSSPIETLSAEAPADEILKAHYRKVYFLDETSRYTLVPNGIFEETDAERIYHLNFGKTDSQMVYCMDSLRLPDVALVYALPSELISSLRGLFPNVRTVCRQSVHVATALLGGSRRDLSHLFVYVYDDFFDAVLVSGGKLQLANTYEYRTEDEFVYFIVALYEHFGLDQYTVETVFSGEISASDPMFATLRKYVRSISFAGRSNFVTGKTFDVETLDGLTQNLSNISLCAL